MGALKKLIWFSTRAGIAGGVVYVAVNKGVFGPPKQSEEFLINVKQNMPDGLKNFREEFVGDFFPKNVFSNFNFKEAWNSGVLKTFNFVVAAPQKAVDFGRCVSAHVSSSLNPEPASEK